MDRRGASPRQVRSGDFIMAYMYAYAQGRHLLRWQLIRPSGSTSLLHCLLFYIHRQPFRLLSLLLLLLLLFSLFDSCT